MRDEKSSSTLEKRIISYSSNIQQSKDLIVRSPALFIAGNPTESANWSTLVVKQSSFQSDIIPNSNIRRYKLLNFNNDHRHTSLAIGSYSNSREQSVHLRLSSEQWYCNTVLTIRALDFSTKRYVASVFLQSLGKTFLVINDVPPQYKHPP